jgi:hypothetical protein
MGIVAGGARDTLRALSARLAEVEAERDDAFLRGMAHGQQIVRGKTFRVLDSPELVVLRARAEAAEARLAAIDIDAITVLIQEADDIARNLGWHRIYDRTTAALAAMKGQNNDR